MLRGAVKLGATYPPTQVAYDCCDMDLFMEMFLVELLTSTCLLLLYRLVIKGVHQSFLSEILPHFEFVTF